MDARNNEISDQILGGFKGLISKEDEAAMSAGPSPLILHAIVEAAQFLTPKQKETLAIRVVHLAASPDISSHVAHFIEKIAPGNLDIAPTESLVPYHGVGPKDLFAMLCGSLQVAEGIEDPAIVRKFLTVLDKTAAVSLSDNPDIVNGQKALNTWKGLFTSRLPAQPSQDKTTAPSTFEFTPLPPIAPVNPVVSWSGTGRTNGSPNTNSK